MSVDPVARARADEAHAKIDGHEELCAERYKNIHDTLSTMKSILGWAGGSIFSLLVATLGWLVVQQVNRTGADTAALRAQIEIMQGDARAIAAKPTAPTTVTIERDHPTG